MSRKIQIGIGFAALVVLLSAFIWIHHSRNKIHDLPSILKSGRLCVLTDSSSIGFSSKGNNVSGFQYEIVKAFADSLKLELVVSEKNDMKACMEGLSNGDYDIIANFIPVTTEYGKNALFTTPFFTSREVLVQQINKGSTRSKLITKHSELANDTIYIPVNSPFRMRLDHLSNEIAEPIHIFEVKNKSSEQMVHMVACGKIKFTICDELFAQRLKLKYPNIDVSLPIGFAQQKAWVVHPNSPLLLEKLNEFLDDFIGSSDYWNIYRKYY
ncbi:MAG: transporter substrate-binding domain-containing protein [Bacteroidota bacterium]|nr:transporter substrate-binding domain-containing protein [Bacteroidota bacterium]